MQSKHQENIHIVDMKTFEGNGMKYLVRFASDLLVWL